MLCMDLIEKKPDKDVIYTLRCAHQKQAQLILLADQKAQILSELVLQVLTLLGTRLIYMEHGSFFCVHGTGNGDFTFPFFALRSLPLHWEF